VEREFSECSASGKFISALFAKRGSARDEWSSISLSAKSNYLWKTVFKNSLEFHRF
jgi:hypothetical protein